VNPVAVVIYVRGDSFAREVCAAVSRDPSVLIEAGLHVSDADEL
jgi:hypothetical protein